MGALPEVDASRIAAAGFRFGGRCGHGRRWQLLAFGGTAPGLMAPAANLPELGVMYDAVAVRRSWAGAKAFLAECLPTA